MTLYLLIWFVIFLSAVAFFADLESKIGVIITVVFGILLLFPAFLSVRLTTTEAGEHNGYITAVQKSGYIWKNYRVYVKTDNQSSQEDVYCVVSTDTDLISKIKSLSETKARVSVKYNGYSYIFNSYSQCNGDTIYEVNEIK